MFTDTLEKQGISLKVQSVEVKYQGETRNVL